jgi:hypothetical protein
MEGSQVWSAARDTPGYQTDKPRTPAGVRGSRVNADQGYRSLRSLNPWLPSMHPSGVLSQATRFTLSFFP